MVAALPQLLQLHGHRLLQAGFPPLTFACPVCTAAARHACGTRWQLDLLSIYRWVFCCWGGAEDEKVSRNSHNGRRIHHVQMNAAAAPEPSSPLSLHA